MSYLISLNLCILIFKEDSDATYKLKMPVRTRWDQLKLPCTQWLLYKCFLSFLLNLHSLSFYTSHQSGPPEASFIDSSIHSLIHSIIHPQGPQSVSDQKRIKPKLCQLILKSLSIQLCPHDILTTLEVWCGSLRSSQAL